jgi:hypothetical protein
LTVGRLQETMLVTAFDSSLDAHDIAAEEPFVQLH